MDADLKENVNEILEVVKQCPDRLQEKCFELLLNNLLASRRGHQPPAPPLQHKPPAPAQGEDETSAGDEARGRVGEQEDIRDADLHVKARRWLKKYALSVDELNQILYKEGDSFLPLYDDLKTTRASESQVRVALLQALVSGLTSGEFQFDGEHVRAECQERKCYDLKHFVDIFKSNSTLFDGFRTYAKTKPLIKLSEDGRKELAELIRELQ